MLKDEQVHCSNIWIGESYHILVSHYFWPIIIFSLIIILNYYAWQAEGNRLALTTLYSLESTISQCKAELAAPQDGKPSWTKRLLLDENLLC